MAKAGVSFAPIFPAWLRPRLTAYVALCVAVCLGLWVVPLFVGEFHAQFFPEVAFHEAAWWDYALLDWLRQRTGLGLLPLLWLLSAAIALALFATMILFEALAWALRLDRRDDAWTSFTWSLRSWRAWLQWLVRATAWALLGLLALALPGGWKFVGTLPGLVALASLPFFAFNATALRQPTPPPRFRMRWPGTTAFVVGVVGIILVEAADLLAKSSGRLEVALPVWLASLVFAAFLLIGWIDRSPPARWAANLHRATRPRVLGAMATQGIRLGLIVLALWLVLLPAAVLVLRSLGDVNGWLESWVAASGPSTSTLAVANVARFATAWWWAGLAALFLLPATPLTWFAAVASGRLLVQLGAVKEEGAMADTTATTGSNA
jgi:hypothetical protein